MISSKKQNMRPWKTSDCTLDCVLALLFTFKSFLLFVRFRFRKNFKILFFFFLICFKVDQGSCTVRVKSFLFKKERISIINRHHGRQTRRYRQCKQFKFDSFAQFFFGRQIRTFCRLHFGVLLKENLDSSTTSIHPCHTTSLLIQFTPFLYVQ